MMGKHTLDESITILMPGRDNTSSACEEVGAIPCWFKKPVWLVLAALLGQATSFPSKHVGAEKGVGALTGMLVRLRLCGKENKWDMG
jgi:hypothetical protein